MVGWLKEGEKGEGACPETRPESRVIPIKINHKPAVAGESFYVLSEFSRRCRDTPAAACSGR